jgi:acyl-CoA hydrolase
MPGSQRMVTLRFLAAPMDANVRGRVDGAKILEWIDKAGYACAVGWSGYYCVTGYVGNIHFDQQITVGHLVEVEARIVASGRTSMHVVCTVASGDPRTGELSRNTSCLLIFVAMDDGKPTPVPTFEPEDDWERQENHRTRVLADVRREIEADMAGQVYTDATESCRDTLRFLAAPSDVNWGGKVHGGYAMHWMASAAQMVAERWHQGYAEIRFAGGFRFYRPMFIGDLVEVDARMVYTASTELHVSVHVRSGDPRGTEHLLTTHCLFVLTARDHVDAEVPVRPWVPRLPEDVALARHAERLIGFRQRIDAPGE